MDQKDDLTHPPSLFSVKIPSSLSAVPTTPSKIAQASPLPVRMPPNPSEPTYDELKAEVARLKELLKKKEGTHTRRGSVVDFYGRLRGFALPASPSNMSPPHLSAVHESPIVMAFSQHLLKPIAVRESVILQRGCGFSTGENGGTAVGVGDKEVPLFDIETAVRGCLELRHTFEVLRRGRPGQHVDAAVTAHSLEVVLHSALMARPWLHVLASCDKSMRYTTKSLTQGKLFLFCFFVFFSLLDGVNACGCSL